MKAARIHQHGGGAQLCFEEIGTPELISPSDVIVRLQAASLNDGDLKGRRGATAMEPPSPRIPGCDGAGVVTALGSAVGNLKVDDAVCFYPLLGCADCENCRTDREIFCAEARLIGAWESGTYAEYIRLPARNCFAIPAGLSYEEAAALPLAYLSAWRMLMSQVQLKPGESLLIRGIGGDIATAALQIATRIGAHVLVSADRQELLAKAKALGAEHGVDDGAGDCASEVRKLTGKRGVDSVVDSIGGTGWASSLAALARGGRLVTCGAPAGASPPTDLRRIFWHHLQVHGSSLGSRYEFRQLLNFIEASGTKPIIDKVFSLKYAAHAQRHYESGGRFGKTVLSMSE